MTGGGRKRGSKWDLKEERQHSLESIRDGSWPARPGMPFHDRETERDWLSQGVAQGVAGRKSDKWAIMEAKDMKKSKHGLPSRNVISGSRGSYKSDRTNPDIVKDWDEDINYNMKMSPGLDDWRQQQNKRNSPEADWNRPCRSRSWSKSRSRSQSRSRSRSRSQSPAHGFRRQSGFQERTRSRSGVSSQICKDFSIGRCRRGNRCQFLHEDIQNDEDGWDTRHRKIGASRYTSPYDSKEYLMKNGRPTDYCSDFLKGNCRKGASCRFVHDGPPNGFAERSTSATTRERERERNRDLSPQQGGEHEHRRSDIPCKFFAAGICRKGKNCKFSHDSLTCASPERSHDDRRGHVRNSSHGDKSWDGQKRSDMDASSDSKRLWDGPKWNDAEASNDVEKSWRGSKWSRSDAYTSTAFSEEKHDKMHVAERRSSGWSISNRGEHVSDLNGACLDLKLSHNAVNSSEKDEGWTKTEKSGTSEPRGIEESLVDMEMSPEWNYKIQQPVTSDVKQERGHIPPSSKSLAHDNNSLAQTRDSFVISQPVATEASFFQKEHITREGTAAVLPSDNKVAIRNSAASTIDLNFSTHILPGQSFDQNAPSSSSFPFSHLSTAVQNQVAVTSDSTLGSLRACQNPGLHQEERSSKRLIIGDTEVPQVNSGTQNMVRNEQLAQLTNLSASLAQIFGNGQPQLPGLYAALNSQNAMQVPSLANSGGLVKPPTEQKQYDPISDCIEPKPKQDGSTKILGFSVNSAGEEKNMEGKSEKISDGIYSIQERRRDGDHYNNNNSERDPDLKGYQSNQQEPVADSEAPKENGEYEETKKAQNENKSGPLDNIDGDEKADESKKVKEGKGVRAFKFALVEFVKDLLKPTWREGQISKEAYKSIVKKVVDKVTTAVQGTNIPQSQEKIDQYLSSSKPKLSKLVQAYVEKRQKG